MANTDRESKCSQDVDDLDAQVEVVKVLLKDSWVGVKKVKDEDRGRPGEVDVRQ